MPVYEYKGVNRAGTKVKGIIDADNQRIDHVTQQRLGQPTPCARGPGGCR